jgi:hypothetical protein
VLHALSWFLVVALLALWSLAAWVFHAVAVWTLSSAGALSGAASDASAVRLPDWLAPWVPPEVAQMLTALLSGLGPLFDGLLQFAPALSGGLAVATWVIWGIGSALLVLAGAGLHLLIARWRRRDDGGGPRGASSLAPG